MKKISLIGSLFILMIAAIFYSVSCKANKQLFCNKTIDKNNSSSNVNEDLFSSSFILMGFH